MNLHLVRHGEALPASVNPARPLSSTGVEAVRRTGRALRESGVEVPEIWHSGKRRAEETAEILAEILRPARGIRAVSALSPNDDPADVASVISAFEEDLLIAGHYPHLPRLASLLLVGDADRGRGGLPGLVDFPTAGLASLRREAGVWTIVRVG